MQVAEWMAKRKVSGLKSNGAKRFVPWEEIKSVAIIIQKKEQLNKSSVDKFIESTNKFVQVYYIEPSSKAASFGDWRCFTKIDATLFKLPKREVINGLKDKKFDVVINTSSEDDVFSKIIFATINSPVKCADADMLGAANLIITKSEPYYVFDYLNEVVKYLKMIKN
jgi:hypothetical protein